MINKKAQTLGIAILSAVIVFIIGFMIINFLMPEVNTGRTSLMCSSPSTISDGTKLLCLVMDIAVPYWILLILSVSVGMITDRLLL